MAGRRAITAGVGSVRLDQGFQRDATEAPRALARMRTEVEALVGALSAKDYATAVQHAGRELEVFKRQQMRAAAAITCLEAARSRRGFYPPASSRTAMAIAQVMSAAYVASMTKSPLRW